LQLAARAVNIELARSGTRDADGGVLSARTSIWNQKYTVEKWREFHRITERLHEISEEVTGGDGLRYPNTKPLGSAGTLRFARECGVAVVLFRVTPYGTYVFASTPNGRSFVSAPTLTRASLDKLLDEIAPSEDRDWRFDPLERVLGILGKSLLKPLYGLFKKELAKPDAVSFRRVVFIANRGLSVLPLHACFWTECDGQKCFTDDFSVSFAPSISIFQSCLERDRGIRREASFVGVFNPTDDLPFTDWEYLQLKELLQNWNCEFLLKSSASVEGVLSRAAGGNVLHFSCHGTYEPKDPMRSFVRLASGTDLTVRQILEDIRLQNTWLVVLSACESGLVDAKDAADEHFGLPIAFLFAGTPTVWSTFWSVSDLAAALLTVRAYQKLLAGEPDKTEVLRQAQLWLRDANAAEIVNMLSTGSRGIEEGTRLSAMVLKLKRKLEEGSPTDKPFHSPYYWAAFHSVGA